MSKLVNLTFEFFISSDIHEYVIILLTAKYCYTGVYRIVLALLLVVLE